MSKDPTIADLIAQTPGAQTREQALERIKTRRQKRQAQQPQPALADGELSKPEPLPIIDKPDQFAADFFKRLKAKENAKRKPPKRSKPRLVIDNGQPEPPRKK